MFDGIAHRYDLLNRLISLGLDGMWRKKTVLSLELAANHRVLDLATGTADLAILVARQETTAQVVGLDPSCKMLAFGRSKIEHCGLTHRVSLVQGDAQSLAFADHTFDRVCMSFGIRNVPNRIQALQEIARVTKPDGKVAILELAEPRGGVLSWLARLHVHHLVPRIGGLLSGSTEYRYLQRSIAAFPSAIQFAAQMSDCGLVVHRIEPLTFGVATLYVASNQNTTGTTAACARS